jgi:hypothetical protein
MACLDRLYAIDELRAGNKRNAEARQREQYAAVARIILHIVHAALDRSDGDGIGHQIRLEAGLDDEQSGEALQHDYQSLSKRRANGSVPPFPT